MEIDLSFRKKWMVLSLETKYLFSWFRCLFLYEVWSVLLHHVCL